ncbi:MAG: hypothetical protein OJJ54_25020 [Pseudonocardia sp.]|nr:hypothetical protein [Pseudonocardia sp.]
MTDCDRDPPAGLGPRGSALWSDLTAEFELDLDVAQIAIELCRAVDVAEALASVLAEQGYTTGGSRGQTRVHPAVAELRATGLLIARLTKELDLPEDEPVDKATSMRTDAARKAANARWDMDRMRSRGRAAA